MRKQKKDIKLENLMEDYKKFYFKEPSSDIDNNFKQMLEKEQNRKLHFRKDNTVRFAFASLTILLIATILFILTNSSNNVVDSKYATNFKDNPILINYYNTVTRSNLKIENIHPAKATIFNYSEKGTEVNFNGQLIQEATQSGTIKIKIYLGENQNAVFNKLITTNSNGDFTFDIKFEEPGQYSWKIVYDNEIIFANNFFIGQLE